MAEESATPEVAQEKQEKAESQRRIPRWIWPWGLAFASLGAAAAVLMRGCWHTRMGWPSRYDKQYSYRVCTDCGIKRLFDEKTFQEYGPYGYDLKELIARAEEVRAKRMRKAGLPTTATEAKSSRSSGT